MSYKTIDIALPGFYLDGRPRDERDPRYVDQTITEVRLVEAVGKHGYHNNGDRWVEHFDISRVGRATAEEMAKG